MTFCRLDCECEDTLLSEASLEIGLVCIRFCDCLLTNECVWTFVNPTLELSLDMEYEEALCRRFCLGNAKGQ
jgi:hypothetical protein